VSLDWENSDLKYALHCGAVVVTVLLSTACTTRDAVTPPDASSLAGPTWRLVSLDGNAVLAGTRVTAVFREDNRVSGSAGCNGYSGLATVKGEQLRVGALASTRMYCAPDAVMAQEGSYLATLEKATEYRVVGGRLQLGSAPGAVSLVYEAE
jgi:heat shock protein HslJ